LKVCPNVDALRKSRKLTDLRRDITPSALMNS